MITARRIYSFALCVYNQIVNQRLTSQTCPTACHAHLPVYPTAFYAESGQRPLPYLRYAHISFVRVVATAGYTGDEWMGSAI